MWTAISAFLGKNKLTVALAAALIILTFLFIRENRLKQQARKELAVAEHNINALNDTLRVTINKAGEQENNKLALLTDKVESLVSLNEDLANEIDKIRGTVNTIIKSETIIKHDTIQITSKGEYKDSVAIVSFNFDTTYSPGNYRKRTGTTSYDLKTSKSTAQLSTDETGISFVTGIKNLDKGKPEIFLTSKYPGFTVTQLEGAVLDPNIFKSKTRPKLITIGLQLGYTPITYSLKTKQLDFDLQRFGGGVGLNFNLGRVLGIK